MPTDFNNNTVIYHSDMIEGHECDFSKAFYYIKGCYIIHKLTGTIVDTVKHSNISISEFDDLSWKLHQVEIRNKYI